MSDPFESARTLHHAGEFALAIPLYQQIIELDPTHFRAHNNLGACCDELGQLDQAEIAFRNALALMPDEAPIAQNLGRILHKLARNEEAEQEYRRSIKLDPLRADTYYNLGRLLQDQNKVSDAADMLHEATRLNPEHVAAHSVLADLLYDQQMLEPALALYRRVIDLTPHDAYSHFHVGKVLETLQRNDEAIESYRRAAEIDKESTAAREALARTFHKAGRHSEAVSSLSDWLAQDPNNPLAAHMLASLGASDTPDRASDGYIRDTFDRFAHDFDHTLEKLQYQAPQLVEQAMKGHYGEPAGNLRVLDAGCGTGLCGPLLRPYAQSLAGVDLSPGMLKLAHALEVYDDLVEDELTRHFSAHDSKFDVIVSADTFCYLGKLDAPFFAAAQALKPGGFLAFTLEQHAGASEYHLQANGRYAHAEPYIQAMLEQAGFTHVDVDYQTLRMEGGKPVAGFVFSATAGPNNGAE